MRRRDAAPAERWAVVVVAVLGGLVAALWSDAAPTASPAVDAAERFLLAATVAAAGSRARRWTLVLATTLAAVGCTGVARVVAVAALLGTMALVETRTRSRVAGAAIGATAGVLVQRMQMPGPVWIEVVVGSVAVAPVLVSGYRRARPDSRSRIRRLGVAGAIGLGCVVAVGVVAALLSAPAVVRAAEHSRSAVAAVEQGDGAAAAGEMQAASQEFRTADGLVGAWWARGAQLIPGAGANVNAVRDAVSIGMELSDGAAVLLADADFDELRSPDGGVDLTALDAIAPQLRRAARQVDTAGARLEDIGSPWIVAPLAEQLDRVDSELGRLRADAVRADLVFAHLPQLLGAEGPRRYLVLLGNPAESRDLGGHIGNWAELEAVDGDIRLVEVGGPLDLSVPDPPSSSELSDALPPSLRAMSPHRHPQNLSATPDLPTAASAASELVRAGSGRAVDGVAYADVETFSAFVSLVGPVDVPGAEPPVRLDAANAVEFLTIGQYQSFPDDAAAGEALEEVIRVVFDRLTGSQLGTPKQLADLFSPLVAEGRFQLASLHAEDVALLDELGLQGALPDTDEHTEVVGVLNRNVGPSKIDAFLTREVTADFTWDRRASIVDGVVHVELHNDAPSHGLSRTVIGNAAGVPDGSNVTDLTVLTPHPVDAVLVDGLERPAQPQKEGSLWRHTVRVTIPAGASAVVDVHLASARRPSGPFRLAWVGQPGVGDDTAMVRVNHVEGRRSPAPFDAAMDARLTWRAGKWIDEREEAER